MSKPVNHHYLPQFLMNPWRDPVSKKVSVFWKRHDRIVVTQRSPKSIGCEENLYDLHSPNTSDPSVVETEVLTKYIDTPASLVHRKLLEGHPPETLSMKERWDFASFCTMLSMRRPELIRHLQEKTETELRAKIVELIVQGGKLNREQAETFYVEHASGIGKDLTLEEFTRQKKSSKYIMYMLALAWRVYHVPEDGLTFALGDNPLMQYKAQDSGFLDRIYLPIGPHTLFVAGTKSFFDTDVDLRPEFLSILPLKLITDQMALAKEFVIGVGGTPPKGFLELAERHLGSGKVSMRFDFSKKRRPQ